LGFAVAMASPRGGATGATDEGKPLPCQSLTTILTGEIVSTAIAAAERRIGDIGTLVAGGSGG
jgi:hypothetical protein